MQNAISFGLLRSDYRQLYDLYLIYSSQPETQRQGIGARLNSWKNLLFQRLPRNWLAFFLNTSLKVLQGGAALGVLFAVAKYWGESGTRQRQAHYQAWQIINVAQGQQGSGGRIEAIQDLHEDHVSLVGLTANGAFLAKIQLENASLDRANLAEADLKEANLRGASLLDANLEGAILRGADLTGANLRFANLEGALLGRSRVEGSDLDGRLSPEFIFLSGR